MYTCLMPLAAIVDFLMSGWGAMSERAFNSDMYRMQHWGGTFVYVPFKNKLLDMYEFLTQVSYQSL